MFVYITICYTGPARAEDDAVLVLDLLVHGDLGRRAWRTEGASDGATRPAARAPGAVAHRQVQVLATIVLGSCVLLVWKVLSWARLTSLTGESLYKTSPHYSRTGSLDQDQALF